MKVQKLPLVNLEEVLPLVKDYLSGSPDIGRFYRFSPDHDGLAEAITASASHAVNRSVLVASLQKQYEQGGISLAGNSLVSENIVRLASPDTFTVTTGHQLCIFGGPLYFIYKIVSALVLCEKLKGRHPERNFVPVFWMASEDHDFAEVQRIHVFGKQVVWDREPEGAVGRMDLRGLDDAVRELAAVLGDSNHARELIALFDAAYKGEKTYADATRQWVHAFFGDRGLVVLDGDDASLKSLFADVMADEFTHQTAHALVSETSEKLATGYKLQINPRRVNLFHLSAKARTRMLSPEETGDGFQAGEEGVSRKAEEWVEMVKTHPESFSPNVVLRPLYQQRILPNIAYIGGGAEVAYWLQLKSAFDHHNILYPVVLNRDSAMWMDEHVVGKLARLGFSAEDLFRPENELVREWTARAGGADVDLSSLSSELQELYARVAQQAASVDPGLERSAEAEKQKALNGLSALESRLHKAVKKNNESSVNQIALLKQKLFPGGIWQERNDNFAGLYMKYGRSFADVLYDSFDPLEGQMKIVGPD